MAVAGRDDRSLDAECRLTVQVFVLVWGLAITWCYIHQVNQVNTHR